MSCIRNLSRILPLLALVLAACAGPKLARPPELDEVKQLPTELIDKFKVEDVKVEPTTPVPTPAGKKPPKASGKKPPAPVAERYPKRRPQPEMFWVGEKLTYDMTYFGVVAGTVTLEVLPPKEVNGRKTHHLKLTAKSSKVFSLFYRLDDWIESFWDFESLFSHRYRMVLDESKQTRDTLELYDYDKKQSFFWSRVNNASGFNEKKEYHPIQPLSQDSISALFFIRTLPLEPGGFYQFPVINDGKNWDAEITVIKKERLTLPNLGEKMTIKVKPQTRFNGALTQKSDSFLWYTDDERRFMVRMEANVKVGTIVAALREVVLGTPP
jgi:hypothetical protein